MRFLLFPLLFAFFACALIGPAGASASLIDSDVAEFPVGLVGTQTNEQEFTFEGGLTAKCKKSSFTGSLTGVSSSFTLTPFYSECTAFGQAATITTTGCGFTLQIGEENESGAFPSTLDIVCEGGSVIKIVTGTCEVQIGGQTGLSAVELSNTASEPIEVNRKLTIAEMAYTKVKDNIGCPLSGTGSKTDGGAKGSILVKGEKAGVQQIVQIGHTVLCIQAPGVGNKCAPKKEHAANTVLAGAAKAEIKVTFDDGKITQDHTVTCDTAKLSVKITAASGGVLRGLPGTFEGITFADCKEGGGKACTVTETKAPTGATLRPTVIGNGSIDGTLGLRVICGNLPLDCEYSDSLGIGFTGGTEPVIETKNQIPMTKANQNCGKKAGSWTAPYKVTKPAAWLAK